MSKNSKKALTIVLVVLLCWRVQAPLLWAYSRKVSRTGASLRTPSASSNPRTPIRPKTPIRQRIRIRPKTPIRRNPG